MRFSDEVCDRRCLRRRDGPDGFSRPDSSGVCQRTDGGAQQFQDTSFNDSPNSISQFNQSARNITHLVRHVRQLITSVRVVEILLVCVLPGKATF